MPVSKKTMGSHILSCLVQKSLCCKIELMENKEKIFDIKLLWTRKVFGIPVIYMLLIYAALSFIQLYLFCPEDDFMCLQGAGSVIKDIFTK